MWVQVVLKRAHNAAEIDKPVRQSITDYAGKGFRALGIGLAEGTSGDRCTILAASCPEVGAGCLNCNSSSVESAVQFSAPAMQCAGAVVPGKTELQPC